MSVGRYRLLRHFIQLYFVKSKFGRIYLQLSLDSLEGTTNASFTQPGFMIASRPRQPDMILTMSLAYKDHRST